MVGFVENEGGSYVCSNIAILKMKGIINSTVSLFLPLKSLK